MLTKIPTSLGGAHVNSKIRVLSILVFLSIVQLQFMKSANAARLPYSKEELKAALKDRDQTWAQTDTDFSLIQKYTHFEHPCYASAQNYLGCMQLINTLGSYLKPRQYLLPKKLSSGPNLKYTVLENYNSDLSLVRIDHPADIPEAVADKAKYAAQVFAALRESAEQLYATHTLIPFESMAYEMVNSIPETPSMEQHSRAYAIGAAVNALIAVHDGHGKLTPLKYFMAITSNRDQSFGGIGLEFASIDQKIVVGSVLEGTPAEQSGIRARDVILGVKQKKEDELTEITGKSSEDVVNLLRGPEETKIWLTIQRGTQTLKDIEVVRKKIEHKNLEVKLKEDMGARLAWIKVSSFVDDGEVPLCTRLKNELVSLPKDVRGIIFDVRENGGGYLDFVVCMAGVFVGKKEIVSVRPTGQELSPEHRNAYMARFPLLLLRYLGLQNAYFVDQQTSLGADSEPERISSERQLTDLPMVVLIDSHSASASEILAGSLQDYKRAYLVGTRTFGKATVQNLDRFRLNPKLLEAYTVSRYYLPSGRTNQIVGVSPDFEVFEKPHPTEAEKFDSREAEEVPTALPPVGPKWVQTRQTEIDDLKARCLSKGKAEALYESKLKEGFRPDYQLLYAEEILACPAK